MEIIATFESLRKIGPSGQEMWSARELQPCLGYSLWQNFSNAIRKAMKACEGTGADVKDHFIDTNKMILIGKGGRREVQDFNLSRYACYLIAMNGEPSHPQIAAAQTYFAVQTRKQEILDNEVSKLSAVQKRVMLREELSEHNKKLASAAKESGVISPVDYAVFQDEVGMAIASAKALLPLALRYSPKPIGWSHAVSMRPTGQEKVSMLQGTFFNGDGNTAWERRRGFDAETR